MRSTCPSCLSQVEHSQSESQVTCNSCGEVYSPFLMASDLEAPSVTPAPQMPMGTFSESSMAFQEIVDFAQNMDAPPGGSSINTPSVPSPVAPPKLSAATEDTSTHFILSTSGLGPAYHIQQWLNPISKICTLGEDGDPLGKALAELKNAGLTAGANAIIDIQCALCPDNRRVLVLGTPVRCQKIR